MSKQKSENAKRGVEGEAAFKAWLDAHHFSYVALCQKSENFAAAFSGHVKRPDFLVLLESVGLIAVDVKNYSQSHIPQYRDSITLEVESEVRASIAFERLFRIPLWYAYVDHDGQNDQSSWHWISALHAVEIGTIKTRNADDIQFYVIERADCAHVITGDDIAKLYLCRAPSHAGLNSVALK